MRPKTPDHHGQPPLIAMGDGGHVGRQMDALGGDDHRHERQMRLVARNERVRQPQEEAHQYRRYHFWLGRKSSPSTRTISNRPSLNLDASASSNSSGAELPEKIVTLRRYVAARKRASKI